MSVTYGGIPLCAVSQEWRERIEAEIPTSQICDSARLTSRGGSNDPPPQSRERPIKLGSLFWPWGASRWAVYHGLATDAQLAQIRPKAYASPARYNTLELAISDGRKDRIVRAPMFLLPPRPLSQTNGGNGLNLVSLVDERYFWWERSAAVTLTAGTTTWATLFASIGTALGVALTVPTVAAAYLKPGADLAASYESLPPLLDLAAASVGRRVVRALDGTVTIQTAAAAKLEWDRQFSLWRRRKGGRFAFDPHRPPHDLAAHLPAQVDVVFPRTDSGTPAASVHKVSVTLTSLSLPELRSVHGRGDERVIKDGAAANFTGGGTPANDTELNTLAQQIASDWYRWRLNRLDVVYNGVAPYEPEGGHDIEWTSREGENATRVQRSEGNGSGGAGAGAGGDSFFGGLSLSRYGTYGSGGTLIQQSLVFNNNTTFTGAYTTYVSGGYAFNFGTSSAPSTAPPGVFMPPVILVNGAPTYSPSATAYQWVQTNTGMYYWNGTSWNLEGPRRYGFDHYINASSSSVDGTEDFVYTDSVAANTFFANGDKLIVRYGGSVVGHATATRTIGFSFGGGTTIKFFPAASVFASSSKWVADLLLIRVSATVVRYAASFYSDGLSTYAFTRVGEITGLTLSSANDLKLGFTAAGVGAAAFDIVAECGYAKWEPLF